MALGTKTILPRGQLVFDEEYKQRQQEEKTSRKQRPSQRWCWHENELDYDSI